jgi:outer membrane protein
MPMTFLLCTLLAAAAAGLSAGPAAGADGPQALSSKKPLSLRDCVTIALRSNPGLAAAGAQPDAAHGRTQQARSALLPQISGSGSASRSESPERQSLVGGTPFSSPENTYEERSVALSARQSLVNVADWKSFATARAGERASRASYLWSQEEIVLAVETAYFNYLKSIQLQVVAQENLKVGEEQLKLAERRHEVGIGVEADILKARAQNAQDRLALITAENDVRIARANLCHVTGVSLDSPLVVDDVSADEPAGAAPAPDVGQAVASRPDVAHQRHQLAAAEHDLGAARARFLPTLDFDFGYQRLLDAKNTVTLPEGDQVSEFDAYGSWRASLSANLPLFTGWSRHGRVNEARANLVAAREGLAQAERDARLQIETASLNATAAMEAIGVSRDGVRAAEEDLRVTQGSYTQGLVPILTLLEAQAALVEAKNAYVSAIYGHRIALAELDRALGRGVAKYAE